MTLGQQIPVIDGLLQWHYILNPGAAFSMGEGFTWETQDLRRDIAAAERAWARAEALMADPTIGLVVLDELNIALRYDYLDLNDGAIVGGRQDAWIAALIWQPVEFLRFNVNYAYLLYQDATPLADGDRDYGVHVTGARMELDF